MLPTRRVAGKTMLVETFLRQVLAPVLAHPRHERGQDRLQEENDAFL